MAILYPIECKLCENAACYQCEFRGELELYFEFMDEQEQEYERMMDAYSKEVSEEMCKNYSMFLEDNSYEA